MKEGRDWFDPAIKLPERGQKVTWPDPNTGGPVHGTYEGGAVWLMDDGVYVYYTPRVWSPR